MHRIIQDALYLGNIQHSGQLAQIGDLGNSKSTNRLVYYIIQELRSTYGDNIDKKMYHQCKIY